MRPVFLGVDVAGASNTWVAALEPTEAGARVVWGPTLATLAEIVSYAERAFVVAVAIDAQLAAAASDETGYRSGDLELQQLLPRDCRNWVQSINSLMAVPVRGQLLAEALGTVVGTVIETHPRASMHFALGAAADQAIRTYKTGAERREAVLGLWSGWVERFGIEPHAPPESDGPVDALVCATVALLYHREPTALRRLPHLASDRRGRGPFYVMAPERESQPDDCVSTAHLTAGAPGLASDMGARSSGLASGNPVPLAHTDVTGPTGSAGAPVPITVIDGMVYRDVVGHALWCPACNAHPFTRWPSGWDAHAAHACPGLTRLGEKERKEEFRERFRHLFRNR